MNGSGKTVAVHRAADLAGRPVAPCIIHIGATVSELLGRAPTMEEAKLAYEGEASLVADALFEHLPQATLDRVLLRLMERKVERTLYKGTSLS